MEPMQPTQQESPPSPPPRPRLERSRDDRAIAGVAAGLARYLGIDVAWVRIGFVVAALFGGSGILAYLIGWIAIPEEGQKESIAADKVGDLQSSGRWIGIALIVLAGMIILGNTGFIDGDLLFAAALIGVGVLLYRGDIGKPRESAEVAAAAPPNTEPSPSADVASRPPAAAPEPAPQVAPAFQPRYEPPAPPAAPPPPPDPAFQPRPIRPREKSPLGRFALAAALIVLGFLGVGQSAGWFEPNLRQYAAAVLVVFGVGLLISSLFGRARWLIVVGLALSPFLVAMAMLKVPFEGGFGEPRYEPTSISDLNNEYRLMAGEMVLDLRDLQLAEDETVTVAASVVFGRLEVIVPPDLGVAVAARVDAGEMFLDGTRGSESPSGNPDNIDIQRTITYTGSGEVILDAHVGFGELQVYQTAEVTP